MRLNACRSLVVWSRHRCTGALGASTRAAKLLATSTRQATRCVHPRRQPTPFRYSLACEHFDACCPLCRSEAGLLTATMSWAQHRWPTRSACAGRLPLTTFAAPPPSAWSQRRRNAVALGCAAGHSGFAASSIARQPTPAEPWRRGPHGTQAALSASVGGCVERHYRSAHRQPRRAAAAASRAEASDDEAGLEAIAREVEAALPQYCAGCGIRLQRDDPDAPG